MLYKIFLGIGILIGLVGAFSCHDGRVLAALGVSLALGTFLRCLAIGRVGGFDSFKFYLKKKRLTMIFGLLLVVVSIWALIMALDSGPLCK